jgi:hypothetical protein
VAFEHLRKLTLDAFLALLPQNFDSEIVASLGTYRYRSSTGNLDTTPDPDTENNRTLRSGKIYNTSHLLPIPELPQPRPVTDEYRKIAAKLHSVHPGVLPKQISKITEFAYWRNARTVRRSYNCIADSILIHKIDPKREFRFSTAALPIAPVFHTSAKDIESKILANNQKEMRQYFSTADYRSRFSSPIEVTLFIKINKDTGIEPRTRICFKEITVHFYDPP